MAVFITARTEPFEQERQDYAEWSRQRDTARPVRRPFRGHQLKEDSYAAIRVMGSNGQFMPVIDAAGWTYNATDGVATTLHYTNFFVQSVAEERHEKQQIVDTFGEAFIFFFGEAPRLVRVQGQLLNTADFNWRNEFWANYERYFRGTRLVEMGARLYLIYDDRIVEGYMVGANATENATNNSVIPFSFQMFVTGQTDLSMLGDPKFPAPNDVDYTQLSTYEEALRRWESSRQLQRELSTEAVAAAHRASSFGSGGLMNSVIRGGLIDGGDPSVAGFVARATMALQRASSVVDGVRQFAPGMTSAAQVSRKKPVRGAYRDNVDEFTGWDDSGTAEELAAPLSMADKWLAADRSMDLSMGGMVAGFDSCARTFSDTMGRVGRASSEVRERGGHRSRALPTVSGSSIGDAVAPRPPIYARDVPFGMSVLEGTLI